MNIKACIFDLDGVIVDTVPAHYVAWKSIADELGIPFNKKENEQLKGVSRKKSMIKILALGNMTKTDEEIRALTEKKNQIYVDIISKMTPADILPGVERFLEVLEKHNIPKAIGSASRNTPTILKCVGLEGRFDCIVDGNAVEKSKPDPQVFLKGAEGMGVKPQECVVFEDAISGVKAAKAGGMYCIGVGKPEILKEADLIVSDMTTVNLETLESLES